MEMPAYTRDGEFFKGINGEIKRFHGTYPEPVSTDVHQVFHQLWKAVFPTVNIPAVISYINTGETYLSVPVSSKSPSLLKNKFSGLTPRVTPGIRHYAVAATIAAPILDLEEGSCFGTGNRSGKWEKTVFASAGILIEHRYDLLFSGYNGYTRISHIGIILG
jgi:hypothetical protein